MGLMRLPRFFCYEGGDPGGIGGVGTSGPGSAAGTGEGGGGGPGSDPSMGMGQGGQMATSPGMGPPSTGGLSIRGGLDLAVNQAGLDQALTGGAGLPGGGTPGSIGAFGFSPSKGFNRGFQAGSFFGGFPVGLIGALMGTMMGYAQPGGNVADVGPGSGPHGGGTSDIRPERPDRAERSEEWGIGEMIAGEAADEVEEPREDYRRGKSMRVSPDVSFVERMYSKRPEDDTLETLVFGESEFTERLF